jgi:hypothetical protein
MKVNMIGMRRKICACVASVGGGDRPCSASIEMPYMSGHAPIISIGPSSGNVLGS